MYCIFIGNEASGISCVEDQQSGFCDTECLSVTRLDQPEYSEEGFRKCECTKIARYTVKGQDYCLDCLPEWLKERFEVVMNQYLDWSEAFRGPGKYSGKGFKKWAKMQNLDEEMAEDIYEWWSE